MTGADRQKVRMEIDSRRRATLQGFARPGRSAKSPVVKAAEHAQRAQDAKAIAAEVIGERVTEADRCQFCGAPTKSGGVCRAHSDLLDNGL